MCRYASQQEAAACCWIVRLYVCVQATSAGTRDESDDWRGADIWGIALRWEVRLDLEGNGAARWRGADGGEGLEEYSQSQPLSRSRNALLYCEWCANTTSDREFPIIASEETRSPKQIEAISTFTLDSRAHSQSRSTYFWAVDWVSCCGRARRPKAQEAETTLSRRVLWESEHTTEILIVIVNAPKTSCQRMSYSLQSTCQMASVVTLYEIINIRIVCSVDL